MSKQFIIRGDGYLEQIKPGVWDCYFSLGKDAKTGKYKRSPKRRFHCKTKTEAKRLRAEYKAELESNNGTVIETKGIVSFAKERYKKKPLKTVTAERRRSLTLKHIEQLFGDRPLETFTELTIIEAYDEVRNNAIHSESELAVIDMRLREIFNYAVKKNVILDSPMEDVPRPEPVRKDKMILDARGLNDVMDALRDTPTSSETIATWIMALTGMRLAEVLALTWECVNLDLGFINVGWQYTTDHIYRRPKSPRAIRKVYIDSELIDILHSWKQWVEETYGTIPSIRVTVIDSEHRPKDRVIYPILFNCALKLMDINNFERWFRNWCVAHGFGMFTKPGEIRTYHRKKDGKPYKRKSLPSGYQGLTPHCFRHSFASIAANTGVPAAALQFALGHADYRTTNEYYEHQQDDGGKLVMLSFTKAREGTLN